MKKINFDTLFDVLNWMITLSNKMDGVSGGKEVKERLPGILGLSLEDERIFAGLRSYLSPKEDRVLEEFLLSLSFWERNRFRTVVAGIPEKEEALEFLSRIIFICNEDGPEKTKRYCLSGNVLSENYIVKKFLQQWRKSLKDPLQKELREGGSALEEKMEKISSWAKKTRKKIEERRKR